MARFRFRGLPQDRLTWYRDESWLVKDCWWLNSQGRTYSAENVCDLKPKDHLDQVAIQAKWNGEPDARHPYYEPAPLLWEILRRHPAIPELRSLASGFVSKVYTEPDQCERELEQVQKKWPLVPPRLTFRILERGGTPWNRLEPEFKILFESLVTNLTGLDADGTVRPIANRAFIIDREALTRNPLLWGQDDPGFNVLHHNLEDLRRLAKELDQDVVTVQFDPSASENLLAKRFATIIRSRLRSTTSDSILGPPFEVESVHYIYLARLDTMRLPFTSYELRTFSDMFLRFAPA